MTQGRLAPVHLLRFAEELEILGDERALDAYERVWGTFPRSVGCDERGTIVGEVLRHPWLIMERERRRTTAVRRSGLTADRVLQELARIAFADPRKVVRRERQARAGIPPQPGQTVPDVDVMTWVELDQLDEDTARAISSIKPALGGGYEVKFHSKLDALRLLAEVTQALTPRTAPLQVRPEDLTDEELAVMLLELQGPQAGGDPVTAESSSEPEVLGPDEGDE